MNKTRSYWPSGLPQELRYGLGEQPLYGYLRHRGEQEADRTAYIFYNKVMTWGTLLDHVRRFARYLREKGVEKGKVAPSELIEWAKAHMAAFKYPRYIEFIDELPATPSGKVLRKLLPRE
ncbi:AMP-binding protein [Geobacillus thermoleovorans]|uniref:AMP-binding protein n=1 Tax=Geobacillus thermoleovorans TaxID=33941 RepID=UPI003DA673EB